MTTKCDFCEKEAVGHCSMQVAIYCKEHQEEAEKIEREMWEEVNRCQELGDAKIT